MGLRDAMIAPDLHTKGGHGNRQVLVFHNHIFGYLQPDRGKVPDSTDTAGYQPVAEYLGIRRRSRQNSDMDAVAIAEGFQTADGINGLSECRLLCLGMEIEAGNYGQTIIFKTDVIQQYTAQVIGPDDDGSGGTGIIQELLNIADQDLAGMAQSAAAAVGNLCQILAYLYMHKS